MKRMRRRNPTTTSASGVMRKTRLSTLLRRMGRALRVDVVTQSDGTAYIVWQFNNGDAIEVRAPSTYAALYTLEDAALTAGGVPGRTRSLSGTFSGTKSLFVVNGVSVSGRRQVNEAMLEYGQPRLFDDIPYRGIYLALVAAWVEALIDEPLIVRRAMDEIRTENWRGRSAYFQGAMQALDRALGGYGVESVSSPESNAGPYYGEVVATYVNLGDSYTETVVFNAETDRFERTSIGDWIERYEAGGGTVR